MGRRIYIGALAVVCATAFVAVVASSAGAATALETENTAFTCVAGVGTLNADCETGSSGTSGHVAITEGEVTETKVTSLNNPTLKVKLAGTNTTLTATGGVECSSCTLTNSTAGSAMHVTFSITITFWNVTINVTNCKVAGGKVKTKPLKARTLSPTKTTLEPVTGSVVAEVVLENSGGTCPLLGVSPVVVEGHVDGAQNGAKMTFASVAGMLNVGAQTATLTGETTVSAKKSTDASFTPVSFT
jgi:hypothetical protein